MAGVYTLHNKFHRANHHSVSAISPIDSGLDPIASKEYPFLGVFYNVLTDQKRTFTIYTNSMEWWSNYTTTQNYSANWMHTRSVYNTVSALSSNWNLGYEGYTTLRDNSGRYDSVYSTVCSYSAEWGSPYLMFTNKPQEYTKSKTFSGQELELYKLIDPDTGAITNYYGASVFGWDLTNQQIAFFDLTQDSKLLNPYEETIFNGGLYTLVINQINNVAGTGYNLEFDTNYRFNNKEGFNNIINKSKNGITWINFIAIDQILYGDVTYLSGEG